MRKVWMFLLFVSVLVVFGCGGGGSSSGGVDRSSGGGEGGGPDVATGTFLDSAVEGLAYTALPSGLQGITNEFGEFDYHTGDEVTFYIGDVILGSATGKSTLTPVDFEPSENQSGYSQKVRNIVRLLQTLDEDNDPSNGIMLTNADHQRATGLTVDFSETATSFEADQDVMTLINGGSLVDETQAIAHFRGTLKDLAVKNIQGSYTLSSAVVTGLQGNNIMQPGTTITGTMEISSAGSLNQTIYVNGQKTIASGTIETYDHYQLLVSSVGCTYFIKYDYDPDLNSLTTILNSSDMTDGGAESIRECVNYSADFIETDTWQKNSSVRALSISSNQSIWQEGLGGGVGGAAAFGME